MGTDSKLTDFQKQLRLCRQQYQEAKARIREVGFICQGSLAKRWIPCGNPKCRCRKDSTKRHGPYYQLSWKKAGKTVSRFLPSQEARLYQEWIDNRRKLADITARMQSISHKATRHILKTHSSKAKPRNRKATGRSKPPGYPT